MKIVYGASKTEQTKLLIDYANNMVEKTNGHIVFITDTDECTYELRYQIRFFNTSDLGICGDEGFVGFINGMAVSNADNEYICIDGITGITGKNLAELKDLFLTMEKLEKDFDVEFVLTCDANKEDLPNFIVKFVQ